MSSVFIRGSVDAKVATPPSWVPSSPIGGGGTIDIDLDALKASILSDVNTRLPGLIDPKVKQLKQDITKTNTTVNKLKSDVEAIEVPDINELKTEISETYTSKTELSKYALKTELQNIELTDYVTKVEAQNSYSSLQDNINTLSTDLVANYARKEDIDNVDLTGYVTTEKIKDYALKTEIPAPVDLSPYATIQSLDGYVQQDDLSGYALKTDLNNYATTDSLSNYATTDTLNNYATTDALNGYATTESLRNYATTETLNNYATAESLQDYATKNALQNYATTESLQNYATTESLQGYTTTDTLTQKLRDYATSANVDNKIGELSNTYATKSELENINLDGYVRNETLNNYPTNSDLEQFATKESVDSTYAKKSELQNISLDGYATTESVTQSINALSSQYVNKNEIGTVKQEIIDGIDTAAIAQNINTDTIVAKVLPQIPQVDKGELKRDIVEALKRTQLVPDEKLNELITAALPSNVKTQIVEELSKMLKGTNLEIDKATLTDIVDNRVRNAIGNYAKEVNDAKYATIRGIVNDIVDNELALTKTNINVTADDNTADKLLTWALLVKTKARQFIQDKQQIGNRIDSKAPIMGYEDIDNKLDALENLTLMNRETNFKIDDKDYTKIKVNSKTKYADEQVYVGPKI